MKTKKITLTTEHWERILDAATGYQDQGPVPAGWQSKELDAASEALISALKDAPEIDGQNAPAQAAPHPNQQSNDES